MISIIIPYVRPRRVKECIDRIKKNEDDICYEIVAEEDVKRIGCINMVNKLTKMSKYDLVMFLQDDSLPQNNFLINAYNKMQEFEGQWGLVGLNDGTGKGESLATHWLAHKKLLPYLGGEFLHSGYKHSYSDNEITTRCLQMGRYKYAHGSRIIHNHPVLNGNDSLIDEDYKRIYCQEWHKHDSELFNKRMSNNWGK